MLILKWLFRVTPGKPRVFWSMDHNQEDVMIAEAIPVAARANIDLEKMGVREEYLRQYKKARTALLAQSDHLKNDYEMVQDDQYPTPNMQIASWLMKNQTKSVGTEQMKFMDFQAPLELECLVAPGQIL